MTTDSVQQVADVEVDARGRVSLKRFVAEHARYRVEQLENGVLVWTPLVSVPVTELTPRLREALAEADRGELTRRQRAST